MLDALQAIVDFFVVIGNLIITFIQSIIQFFVLIFEFTGYLGTTVAFLPTPLVAFVMMGITVSVLLLIVGRN